MDDVSHSPLTPLRFLERASQVHPDAEAIVDGSRRMTYGDMATEVTVLAHALRAAGVAAGDRIAILCPNSPEMLIAHFAVAACLSRDCPPGSRPAAQKTPSTAPAASTSTIPPPSSQTHHRRTSKRDR
jgi:non-ribosomal peptide synthetase component F